MNIGHGLGFPFIHTVPNISCQEVIVMVNGLGSAQRTQLVKVTLTYDNVLRYSNASETMKLS